MPPAACAAALVLAAAGCGGGGQSPDQKAVSQTVHDYLHAFASEDAKAACATFTPELRTRVATAAGKTGDPLAGCASAYAEPVKQFASLLSDAGVDLDDIESIGVKAKIEGSTATATVEGASRGIRLAHVGDRWLISESFVG